MLLSQTRLRQLLGLLWLIDGGLQLQPQMFTMNMVNGVMVPMTNGQPGPIAASLHYIIQVTTQNLTLVNLIIAVVQILLGIWLLTGSGVKQAVIFSFVWAFVVWYGGEGMSMLLTGQASVLTGAPGAVLLYPLLGLAIYPRQSTDAPSKSSRTRIDGEGLLSRLHLRYVLAGFWLFAALLQLQPYWWHQGQISQAISGMVGQGGLNAFVVDPVLQWLSTITASIEISLNIVLILVFLGLGIALVVVKQDRVRPFLIASIVVSIVIWYCAEAFGMILTGMATDFNSGLLLVVMALACWPKAHSLATLRSRVIQNAKQPESETQPA